MFLLEELPKIDKAHAIVASSILTAAADPYMNADSTTTELFTIRSYTHVLKNLHLMLYAYPELSQKLCKLICWGRFYCNIRSKVTSDCNIQSIVSDCNIQGRIVVKLTCTASISEPACNFPVPCGILLDLFNWMQSRNGTEFPCSCNSVWMNFEKCVCQCSGFISSQYSLELQLIRNWALRFSSWTVSMLSFSLTL
jgi:hypothetical protein